MAGIISANSNRRYDARRGLGVLIAVAALALVWSAAAPAEESVSTRDSWLQQFFTAYNTFDGSHLAYYHPAVDFVDVTAARGLAGREALREIYEQSKGTYESVRFDIEEHVTDGGSGGDGAATVRHVVRGRLRGAALGKEYDVPFVTWLEVEKGLITRQTDFVDYTLLRQQVLGNAAGGEQ